MPDTITLRDDAMNAIVSLTRAHRALACAVSEAVGLPSPGLGLLRLLTCCESVTISQIATTLRVDQSVASRQVTALVDRGLVERDIDTADRRVHPLRLTDAGREVYARAVAEIAARAEVGFAGWSAAELDEVAAGARRLAEAIERSVSAGRADAQAGAHDVRTTSERPGSLDEDIQRGA
ncbi:MAG: MarR family winged helix-turn-helix transcriptional regulator [Micrococcales bacterium]|nr:MarR family winged helix-turn-helix transcriptional regulator [Micrococcales bacterium]MCL2668574.1 MarR family winged helix-turn-helix transcriptional regulator [Micrococcales bacterium]